MATAMVASVTTLGKRRIPDILIEYRRGEAVT
jgi:hypothetical protein